MQLKLHAATCSYLIVLTITLATLPCHGHGDYHEKIQAADALIAADPGNAQYWFQRAHLNLLHGDWLRSLRDLDAAERLAPGEYPVDLLRGQAWMAGGKFQQAKRALDQFVKSNPDSAQGLTARGRLMMKIDHPDAAAADLRQAIANTPSPEPDLYTELADALIAAGHPQEAVKELGRGISTLGAIPSLAHKALEIELSLGQFDAALARVATMQASAPRPEPWMAKRASILAQAERPHEAEAAWRKLRTHLLSLPDQERNAPSMSQLLEQCQQALAVPSPGP